MNSSKRSIPSSYTKGVFLLIILVVALLIYQRITNHGIPSQVSNLITDEFGTYRDFKEFSEDKKTELKKEFAGFWVYKTEDSTSPVQKWDHLELRDNGIIWQVIDWFIELPSGDTASVLYARTAYMNPFGKIPEMEEYGCDVRIIRQTFARDKDTCYGESQVDQMWHAQKEGDDLILNRKRYTPYHGELENFFPEGALDLVDMLIDENCNRGTSLQSYAKDFMKENFIQSSPIQFNEDGVKQWIDHYYRPAVIDEILELISPVSALPDSVQIEFGLSADGQVIKPRFKSAIMINSTFHKMVLAEIGTWVFPKITDAKSAQINYTFRFNNN